MTKRNIEEKKDEEEQEEQELFFGPAFFRMLAKDALLIVTLSTAIGYPIMNMAVFQPIEQLSRRIDKTEMQSNKTLEIIESMRASNNEKLGAMDKNMAVMAERNLQIRALVNEIKEALKDRK